MSRDDHAEGPTDADALSDRSSTDPPSTDVSSTDPSIATPSSTEPSVGLRPVTTAHRIEAIDVLRGTALLGILAVNIQTFAFSGYQDLDPRIGADFSGANFWVWVVIKLIFEAKMYTIFSMLFGAGLVLMDRRAQDRRLWRVYYCRLFWLLIVGLIHAYFVWEGDILVAYAICGALLFPLRRLSARILIPLALIGFSILPAGALAIGFLAQWMERTAAEAKLAGDDGTELQRTISDVWHEIGDELEGTPDQLAEEKRIVLGGYWKLFRERATYAIAIEIGFVLVLNWGFLGVMLIGICLMKADIFSAARSTKFYAGLILSGYGLGLPMVGYSIYDMQAHDFQLVRWLIGGFQLFSYGSLLVSLGHIGLIMSVFKLPWGRIVLRPLAAAGRMSLTNYLSQSLICAFVFYGWGLGYFSHLDRVQVLGVVVAIWIVQLVVSVVWLRYFRFGPAEWVWRSLTYRKLQPMWAG